MLVHIIQFKSSHEYSERSTLAEFSCYYMKLISSCLPEADSLCPFILNFSLSNHINCDIGAGPYLHPCLKSMIKYDLNLTNFQC